MAMKIIRAEVPEPVYDQHQRIMVMPAGLTDAQVTEQMLRLLCERGECGHEPAEHTTVAAE
jgi:hypothetical protein